MGPVTLLMLLCALNPAVAQSPPRGRDTSVAEASWERKSRAQARKHVRSLLEAWAKPSAVLPLSPCFSRPAAVSGFWTGGRDPGSCMRIRKLATGYYSLIVLAESHEAQWRLERTGTFSGGALQLTGPIMDTDLAPFDALFPVAVGDRKWLVSGSALEELRDFVDRKGCAAVSEQWLAHTLWAPAGRDAEDYCREMLRLPERSK